jgi:hypothetical protein
MRKTKAATQPSQAHLRPILDAPSAWRVDQYAKATGRPYSNAVRSMVESAWNAHVEQKTVEVLPGKAVPGEDFNTPRQSAAFYLSTELLAEIKRIASAERRTQSNVVTQLMLDGLRARRAAVLEKAGLGMTGASA